jgi:hypothetical protein
MNYYLGYCKAGSGLIGFGEKTGNPMTAAISCMNRHKTTKSFVKKISLTDDGDEITINVLENVGWYDENGRMR